MGTLRVVGILAVSATATLVSSTAFAQQIRSYGSQAEKQYGTSYQGSQSEAAVQASQGQQGGLLPTEPQRQQQQAGQQQAGEEGEGDEVEASYVTVFRPGGSQAALPVDLTPDKMYRGVIPGTRDEVEHLTQAREVGSQRSERNRMTWVGFQPQESSTRVFFQTARTAEYNTGQGDNSVTLTFTDTTLSARNFGRFIDTSFFDRNVQRIEVEQVDKTTVVATITLQQYTRPNIDRSGSYLYIDFPYSGTTQRSDDSE